MSRQFFLFCIIISFFVLSITQTKKQKNDVKEYKISEKEFFGELDFNKLKKPKENQPKVERKEDEKKVIKPKENLEIEKTLNLKQKEKIEFTEDEILMKISEKVKKLKPLIVENTNKTHTETKLPDEMKVVTENTTDNDILEQDREFIEKQEENDDLEGLNDHFEEEISNSDVKDEL